MIKPSMIITNIETLGKHHFLHENLKKSLAVHPELRGEGGREGKVDLRNASDLFQ